MKRLVVISDLHCGSNVGLTPPEYKHEEPDEESQEDKETREKMWEFFSRNIDELKPIHRLVVNGDAIEGNNYKESGSGLIVARKDRQWEMAAEVMNYIDAEKVLIIHGTSYHTGYDTEYEDNCLPLLNAQIKESGDHVQKTIDGVTFDFKHRVSRSIIPHGRFTAIAREQMWNVLEYAEGKTLYADVIVRSHVHYHVYAGRSGRLMVITPGLQAPGTKYGIKVCTGDVDVGFIYFDIEENGAYTWGSKMMKFRSPTKQASKW